MPKKSFDTDTIRQRLAFKCSSVHVNNSAGEIINFPVVELYDTETETAIWHPGYERYLFQSLGIVQTLEHTTLVKKIRGLCSFLNHLLHTTDIVDLERETDIQNVISWMEDYRMWDDVEPRDLEEWERGVKDVILFLISLSDDVDMEMDVSQLYTTRQRQFNNENACKFWDPVEMIPEYLGVPAPDPIPEKTMVLYHDLEHVLQCAASADPMLVLAIALGAYAGVRPEEVPFLSNEDIKREYDESGTVSRLTLNLPDRTQEVYPEFIPRMVQILDNHETEFLPTETYHPLFMHTQERAMTAETYADRLEDLFSDHVFLYWDEIGERSLADDDISMRYTMDERYPVSVIQMPRDWYRMYLITQTNLSATEIAKWLGYKNPETVLSFIRDNKDIIELYRKSAEMWARTGWHADFV